MNKHIKLLLLAIIIILLNFKITIAQSVLFTQKIDLDNDEKIEEVSIKLINNLPYLIVNNVVFNLNCENVATVIDTTDLDKIIIFDDLNNDKKLEILLSTDHPIIGNRTLCQVFSFYNNKITRIPFYQSTKNFNELDVYKQAIYDYKTKTIYIPTKRTEEKGFVYYYIDSYSWNIKNNRLQLSQSCKLKYNKTIKYYYQRFICK